MRRALYGLLLLGGCIGGGIVAAPPGAAAALVRAGVRVERARWCDEGLCFDGVARGEVRARHVVVRWDRVVRVHGATVPVGTVMALAGGKASGDTGGGGSGDPVAAAAREPAAAARPAVPSWLTGLIAAVDVVDLHVPGTPLPALSGRVWPDRRLTGDGLAIEGDTVRATVPTPLGELAVEASRGSDGVGLVARCAACVLPAPSAADVPLPLPEVVTRGTWADGAFTGRARVGDVEVGVVARPEGRGVTADLSLPSTPIAAVYTVFAPWVPEAGRARIEGTMHATARVRWSAPGGDAVGAVRLAGGGAPEGSGDLATLSGADSEPSGAAAAGAGSHPAGAAQSDAADDERAAAASGTGTRPGAGGFVVDAFDPVVDGFTVDGLVPESLAGGPFQFRGRDGTGADRLFTRGEGTPDWVPLAELGPWLPAAVIAAEDGGFRAHPGYDLAGMREAAAANAAEGGVVRGGSTLSQQLAKNLFLDGTRSYARKLRELLYAVEMERELGKRRILELYLNVVEFGPGLRGARAAADTYFLKAPAGLRPEEAAWLASILRSPSRAWKRQYLGGAVDTGRVRWILENMRGVPEEARAAALDRPVRLVPPG